MAAVQLVMTPGDRECENPTCFIIFTPPKKDPTRTLCRDCMTDRGIPKINLIPKEETSEPIRPRSTCSECDMPFIPLGGELRCAACISLTPVVRSEEYLKLLEIDERPAPISDGLPIWKRLDKNAALEYAAELAADMETGFYIPDGEEKPWPEGHRFVMREIMRRMGYSESYVFQNQRPAWFPKEGMQGFRGYVEWKKYERAQMGQVRWEKVEPYVEAVMFAGFSELAKRIKLEPGKIPFRDLAQFTMRGLDMMKNKADPFHQALSEEGADAWKAINDAIDSVGDDQAKKQIAGFLQAILIEGQKRTRQVIEVPAKAG